MPKEHPKFSPTQIFLLRKIREIHGEVKIALEAFIKKVKESPVVKNISKLCCQIPLKCVLKSWISQLIIEFYFNA